MPLKNVNGLECCQLLQTRHHSIEKGSWRQTPLGNGKVGQTSGDVSICPLILCMQLLRSTTISHHCQSTLSLSLSPCKTWPFSPSKSSSLHAHFAHHALAALLTANKALKNSTRVVQMAPWRCGGPRRCSHRTRH